MNFNWQRTVRLRWTSAGNEPLELLPGHDLVLDMPREQGVELPHGVLLDDWLRPDSRGEIDEEAIRSLESWRTRRDAELTLDGVCLPHIWQVELLAEVFLTETRIISGLRAVFMEGRPRSIELHGLDEGRAACLRGVLASLGIEVRAPAHPAPPPRYASGATAPRQAPLSRRITGAMFRTIGVPQWIRGEVYLLPYWHLRPVFERLAATDSLGPVLDPGFLPRASRLALLRAAVRGGWVGSPSVVDRRRSRQQLALALAAARASAGTPDSLSALLDARALTMLEQRAASTLSTVGQLRRAFASKRLKLAVLPFDSPPDARAIVQAARDTGLPTLVVQHGFHADENNPDKTLADALAVWSEHDVRHSRERTSALVERTGNPGVTPPIGLTRARPSVQASSRSIVLVQYASRLSIRYDDRVSLRHADAALLALAAARPGTAVTIRPHPAEHEPEIFTRVASRYRDLEVSVDVGSPIGELIAASDLCIGAVSTAALEAAAAGVPLIFLNATDTPAPWPFDGSTDVPVAESSDKLAELIPLVLSSGVVPGQATMLDALGVRADATARVIDLIRRLTEGGDQARPQSPTRAAGPVS